MRPCVPWKSWTVPADGGCVFAQEPELQKWWAAIDVTLAPQHKSLKLGLPHPVVRAPGARFGEVVTAQVLRSHGRHALLVILGKDPEAVIDLVAALDPQSAERLHAAWRREEKS